MVEGPLTVISHPPTLLKWRHWFLFQASRRKRKRLVSQKQNVTDFWFSISVSGLPNEVPKYFYSNYALVQLERDTWLETSYWCDCQRLGYKEIKTAQEAMEAVPKPRFAARSETKTTTRIMRCKNNYERQGVIGWVPTDWAKYSQRENKRLHLRKPIHAKFRDLAEQIAKLKTSNQRWSGARKLEPRLPPEVNRLS